LVTKATRTLPVWSSYLVQQQDGVMKMKVKFPRHHQTIVSGLNYTIHTTHTKTCMTTIWD